MAAEAENKIVSEPGPEGGRTGQRWALAEVQWRLCGKGQSSGSSDIIEESDELVTNGEGDSAAQNLQEQQEQCEVSLMCRPKDFK